MSEETVVFELYKDGKFIQTYDIPMEYVDKWIEINNCIKDTGDTSAIPVESSPETFNKVIEFTKNNLNKVFPVKCICGKGNADYGHPQDKEPKHCINCKETHKYKGRGLINITKETSLTAYEEKFCDVGHSILTDLIRFANFINYPYLLHVTCKYLSNIIEKGKIKEYFGVTREEYDMVERENPWMNEKS